MLNIDNKIIKKKLVLRWHFHFQYFTYDLVYHNNIKKKKRKENKKMRIYLFERDAMRNPICVYVYI